MHALTVNGSTFPGDETVIPSRDPGVSSFDYLLPISRGIFAENIDTYRHLRQPSDTGERAFGNLGSTRPALLTRIGRALPPRRST